MCACQKFLEQPRRYSRFGASILRSILSIFLILFSLDSSAQNETVEPAKPNSPTSPVISEKVKTPIDPEAIEEPVGSSLQEKPTMDTDATSEAANGTTEVDSQVIPESTEESTESPEEVPEYFKNIMKEIDGGEEPTSNTTVGDEGLSMLSEAVGRMVMGLSVVLAMILILYYLARRYGKNVPALSGYQLGQVVGQVHLTRTATLHYVKTGGRILVIGVTDRGVNLVAEFDESAFSTLSGATQGQFDPESFVDELKQQTATIRGEEIRSTKSDVLQDDDISALRGDINRLQDYLQEENRDQND